MIVVAFRHFRDEREIDRWSAPCTPLRGQRVKLRDGNFYKVMQVIWLLPLHVECSVAKDSVDEERGE